MEQDLSVIEEGLTESVVSFQSVNAEFLGCGSTVVVAPSMASPRSLNFLGKAIRAVVASPSKILASGVRRLRQLPARCCCCVKAVGAARLLEGYPSCSFSRSSFSVLDSGLLAPASGCLHSGILSASSSEHSTWWRGEAMHDIPDSSCSLSFDRLSFDLGYLPSFPDSGIASKPERSSELSAFHHVMHTSPVNSGSLEDVCSEPHHAKSSVAGHIERNQDRSNVVLNCFAPDPECPICKRSDVVVDLSATEEIEEIQSASSSSDRRSSKFQALFKQLMKASMSKTVAPKFCRPWRGLSGDRSYETTSQRGIKYGILV